ncbi:MAG: GDSL-type esterase/lipase family protein [Cyclobacteriaceae bacterium]
MKRLILIVLSFVSIDLFGQNKTYDSLPNMPEHYVKRYELFKKDSVVEGKIMMVGNSITEGGNWKKLLNDSTIINRGISGDVTFGVLNRMEDIVKRKPSKVFLLIGINDLSRNTPDEVILENLFTIISKIKSGSPTTEIFVQSILPTNDSFKNLMKEFRGKDPHITLINTQLKRYADRMKYNFIDLYKEFLGKDGNMDAKYVTDGLHLNALGYQHWVSILRAESKTGMK